MPAAPATDCLIIGGGIPALTTAEALISAGADVAVVDDDNPSASWAGAGILSPLPPWRYPAAVRALAADGASAYPALLRRLGDDCDWRQSGMTVFAARPDDSTATFLPHIEQIRPPRLIRALRRFVARRRIVARVAEVIYHNGQAVGARLVGGGVVRARRIVLSAGVWSRALCPPPPPSIIPCRGQMIFFANSRIRLGSILLRAPDSSPTSPASSSADKSTRPPETFSETFYMVQRPDGALLAGAADTFPADISSSAAPSAQNTDVLLQKARVLFPQLPMPDRSWTGIRPMSADNLPIVAAHPTIGNLYLNTAHGRYGVTMAPATAQKTLHLLNRR